MTTTNPMPSTIAEPILSQARIDEMVASGFWKDTTILNYFDRNVAEHPNKVAVVDYNTDAGTSTTLSNRQLQGIVDRIALCFADIGIKKGDVVAMQLPNWWQFMAITLAAARVGACINPLMPIFRHRELEFMLSFTDAKVFICPKEFHGFDYPAMLEELRPKLPILKEVFSVGGETNPGSFEERLLGRHRKDEMDSNTTFDDNKLGANDVFELLYTSGTTGTPKCVMQTSAILIAGAEGFADRYSMTSEDSVFMGSPLAHQTGFLAGLLLPIYMGSKAVFLDIWNAEKAIEIIVDENVTFTIGSTPFLSDMCYSPAAQKYDISCLKTFVSAGSPIPRAMAQQARENLQCGVYSAYGMTEILAVTMVGPEDSEEKTFATDGSDQKGAEVRVVSPDGDVASIDEEGELQARGAFNFVGYMKKPEAYDTDDNGWFNTGDLARKDEDGFIRITGRSKDIIIRGGENVPVVEVENLIIAHPAVLDAALVGKPDDRLGERGYLFVTLRPGASLTFDEVINYFKEKQMAKQYWPEFFEVLGEFPRNMSGKIQKFRLRDQVTGS